MRPVLAALAWMALSSVPLPPSTLRVQVVPSARAVGSDVALRRLDTGECVGRWRLDGHGAFEASLPPGFYLVEFPRLPGRPVRMVSLRASQLVSLVVSCPAGAKAGTRPPFMGSVARPILEGARQTGLGADLPEPARRPAEPSR